MVFYRKKTSCSSNLKILQRFVSVLSKFVEYTTCEQRQSVFHFATAWYAHNSRVLEEHPPREERVLDEWRVGDDDPPGTGHGPVAHGEVGGRPGGIVAEVADEEVALVHHVDLEGRNGRK